MALREKILVAGRSMKICQVLASNGWGGLEKHVAELSGALAERHRVVVLCSPSLVDFFDPRVECITVEFSRSRRNPLLLLELFSKLRGCGCDLIHAQANKAAALTGALRPFLKVPVVASIHNQKRSLKMFRRFEHLIAVSKGVAQLLPSERVEVIYNGIRPPLAGDASQVGFHRALPTLVSVGRLVPAKGFDLLIEAVRGLELQLLIVGDGPQREALQGQVEANGQQLQVLFMGHRDDATQLIEAADGVVIASRLEGFSYVFAEALLLRRPILSTDVPVANEVLERELIVPTENIEALRDAIAVQIGDMAGWRQHMVPAFALGTKMFTLEAMAAHTERFYRTLLGNEPT